MPVQTQLRRVTRFMLCLQQLDQAPTIAAIYPSFPGHWAFVASAVQLTHQHQTLPPTFTVIATGEMNLTAAQRFYSDVAAENPTATGLIVVASNSNQDTTESRNAGANVVHTQLLSFLDSDDQPHPQRYEMLRWMHERTRATFMLHRWSSRACGGAGPGVTFTAVPQTNRRNAHHFCYTPEDFLGVNTRMFLPAYQHIGSAAWKGHIKTHFTTERHGTGNSHPTVVSGLFDLVQFKEAYEGSDDLDYITKASRAYFSAPGFKREGFGLFLYLEMTLSAKCPKRSTHNGGLAKCTAAGDC